MQTLLDEHDLILMEAAIVEPIRRDAVVSLDPHLVHAGLIYDSVGRAELRKLYLTYAEIALDAGLPFLMCTPTWRTNSERIRLSAADANINRHAVEFLLEIRDELQNPLVKVGGLIGCKNDCYQPDESLGTEESKTFHSWQIDRLADTGVDFLFAATLPSVDEAAGIALALAATETPYFLSFVIDRSGALLDGTSLATAIETVDALTVDALTDRSPTGYFVNCAHPTFLLDNDSNRKPCSRMIGFQGNASSLDHSELDGAEELRMDSTTEWGDAMLRLHREQGIKILGGCCGTNQDHLRDIVGKYRGRCGIDPLSADR